MVHMLYNYIYIYIYTMGGARLRLERSMAHLQAWALGSLEDDSGEWAADLTVAASSMGGHLHLPGGLVALRRFGRHCRLAGEPVHHDLQEAARKKPEGTVSGPVGPDAGLLQVRLCN